MNAFGLMDIFNSFRIAYRLQIGASWGVQNHQYDKLRQKQNFSSEIYICSVSLYVIIATNTSHIKIKYIKYDILHRICALIMSYLKIK